MPNTFIAESIRVRISCLHIATNIVRKIPLALSSENPLTPALSPPGGEGACNRQVDLGQIARVIAIPRADEKRDQIARLHRQRFDRRNLCLFTALGNARRQSLSCRAASQL